MTTRHIVRAVLFDGDHLVFLRRGWPGLIPAYCTTVGGGVEPADADVEAALRREVLEEIGGTLNLQPPELARYVREHLVEWAAKFRAGGPC